MPLSPKHRQLPALPSSTTSMLLGITKVIETERTIRLSRHIPRLQIPMMESSAMELLHRLAKSSPRQSLPSVKETITYQALSPSFLLISYQPIPSSFSKQIPTSSITIANQDSSGRAYVPKYFGMRCDIASGDCS